VRKDGLSIATSDTTDNTREAMYGISRGCVNGVRSSDVRRIWHGCDGVSCLSRRASLAFIVLAF
jgi:hypothetical protein